METIKTQIVSGQTRIITKIVDEDRRVSCSCCGCFCDKFLCFLLTDGFSWAISPTRSNPPLPLEETVYLEIFNPETQDYEFLGNVPLTYHGQFGSGWATTEGKPPAISFIGIKGDTIWRGWERYHFCFRFVCREVSTESENGTVICSKLTCGPSINELNLTENLFQDLGENEEKSNLLATETQSGVYVYCFDFFGWRKPRDFQVRSITSSVPRDDAYKLYSIFYNPN